MAADRFLGDGGAGSGPLARDMNRPVRCRIHRGCGPDLIQSTVRNLLADLSQSGVGFVRCTDPDEVADHSTRMATIQTGIENEQDQGFGNSPARGDGEADRQQYAERGQPSGPYLATPNTVWRLARYTIDPSQATSARRKPEAPSENANATSETNPLSYPPANITTTIISVLSGNPSGSSRPADSPAPCVGPDPGGERDRVVAAMSVRALPPPASDQGRTPARSTPPDPPVPAVEPSSYPTRPIP